MEKIIFSSLGENLKQEDRNKIGKDFEEFLFKEKKDDIFLHTRLIVNRKTKEPLYMFNILECNGFYFKNTRKKYGENHEEEIFNYLKNHNSSLKSKNNIIKDDSIIIDEKVPSNVTYITKYKKDGTEFDVILKCKFTDDELRIKDYKFTPISIGKIQDIPNITQNDIIQSASKLFDQIEANKKVKKLEEIEYEVTYNYREQIINKVQKLLSKERF